MATKSRPAESAASDKKSQSMHSGHRARMRSRVRQNGLHSLAEHEMLEYLLFFVLPRQDTNPIAHALLDRFHTFANVLEASEEELQTVSGIGPSAAEFLHALFEVHRYCQKSEVGKPKRLVDTGQTAAYLVPLFHGKKQEQLLLLALDDRDRLLRPIRLDEGSLGSLNVNISKVAAQALSAGATVVILAHNHPGGLVLPSKDDVFATAELMRALAVLQIRVRDHFIVSGEEWLSMRESRRLPYYDPATGEVHIFQY